MTRNDIQAGDYVQSSGDRRIAGISGRVVKANRATLELETSYMNKPMDLKVRRDDLRGKVKLKRGDAIMEVMP